MVPARAPHPLFAALLLLAAVAAACGGSGEPPTPAPVAEGASVETLHTADGLQLDARLYPSDSGRLAILLHMYPADQTSWSESARALQTSGVAALTFDFRGYGASGGDKDATEIEHDVRAALEFARRRGYREIVLVGASMGGTAAIVVAAEQPAGGELAGVITLSAPAEFGGLDAQEVVGDVAVPLSLIASRGDTSARNSLETLAESGSLPQDRTLVVEGRAHGTDLLTSDAGEQVWQRLLAFLDEIWGQPSP